MKPARFAYARPRSLSEATDLLARHGSDSAILAGGQSLMPLLNLRMAQPAILIDINGLAGLAEIARDGDYISIGGRARYRDVLNSAVLRDVHSLLLQAIPLVAHAAIRNRGTVGGSLALADPAAEMPVCAVCLDAEIIVLSHRGERRIAAADFFQGIYATALAPDEMIVRVLYPVLDPQWDVAFDEIARRHGDFAMAALAVCVRVVDGRIADCRIVFGGVESHPRRMTEVEAALIGHGLADQAARAAATVVLDSTLSPLQGGEYPPDYRRQLTRVLLGRLLARIEGKHA